MGHFYSICPEVNIWQINFDSPGHSAIRYAVCCPGARPGNLGSEQVLEFLLLRNDGSALNQVIANIFRYVA